MSACMLDILELVDVSGCCYYVLVLREQLSNYACAKARCAACDEPHFRCGRGHVLLESSSQINGGWVTLSFAGCWSVKYGTHVEAAECLSQHLYYPILERDVVLGSPSISVDAR
jgi:hypothetical protein